MRDKGPSQLLSSMPKDLYTVFRRKQDKAPKALKLPKDNNKISQINNH